MLLILISFLAGALSVLTPCALPLLPVVLSGTLSNKSRLRPIIITLSLTLSIILFTLLLKVSTVFIYVSEDTLRFFSAAIIIGLGIATIFPDLWTNISIKFGLEKFSQKFFNESAHKEGIAGAILTGLALGPIFSSCSPTYGYVVFTVLPANFINGLMYLISYSIGLGVMMLLISIFGQSLITKFKWATNPYGLFRRILGIIFIIVGISILFKLDKQIESALLDSPLLAPIDLTKVDQGFIDNLNK